MKKEHLKAHRNLSVFVLVLGIVLMIFMIVVEDEPGGIPVLLILVGTGWFFISRSGIRSQNKQ